MGKQERRAYLETIRARYRRADKAGKAAILDEFCAVCEYHRKYALRLLSNQHKPRKKAKRKPGPDSRYDKPELVEVLRTIWLASDQLCSKRLKSVRAKVARKGLSGAKPGTLLKKHIPIQAGTWDVTQPGFMETDTVAHCGDSLAGNFVWSLTMTDICTAWTECRATWNKGSHGVMTRIKSVQKALPFAIKGFDCDNGSEFLNWHLQRYFQNRKQPIQFTRSRPYHSNDNAHVEQKTGLVYVSCSTTSALAIPGSST